MSSGDHLLAIRAAHDRGTRPAMVDGQHAAQRPDMAPARWDGMCDPVLTRDPGVAVGDRDRHPDLLIRRALASIHARDRHPLRCPAVRPHWPAPKAMTRPQATTGT